MGDPTMETTYILFAQYLTNQNRIEDANACYQAGIRHIQSQKLQEQYIQFLKEINNIYNKRAMNDNHKTSNSANNTFKHKLSKINTSTHSVNTSTSSSTTVQSVQSSASNNAYHRQTASSYSNKPYVPPSPFVSSIKAPQQFPSSKNFKHSPNTPDYDMGFDYYRPAPKNNKQNKNNNTKRQKNTANVTNVVNGDDPGCIVM